MSDDAEKTHLTPRPHSLTARRPLRGAPLLFGEVALCLSKRLLFIFEEVQVSTASPVLHVAKVFSPTAMPTACPLGEGGRLSALTREAAAPLSGTATCHGGDLGRPFERARHNDRHLPDVSEAHSHCLSFQLAAHRNLGEGEAVLAAGSPRGTDILAVWCLHRPQPPKVGVNGSLEARQDILQHLRVHCLQSRALRRLQPWQLGPLCAAVQCLLPLLPRLLAIGEQRVPEPGALLHVPREEPLPLPGGIQVVVRRFPEHTRCIQMSRCFGKEGSPGGNAAPPAHAYSPGGSRRIFTEPLRSETTIEVQHYALSLTPTAASGILPPILRQ